MWQYSHLPDPWGVVLGFSRGRKRRWIATSHFLCLLEMFVMYLGKEWKVYLPLDTSLTNTILFLYSNLWRNTLLWRPWNWIWRFWNHIPHQKCSLKSSLTEDVQIFFSYSSINMSIWNGVYNNWNPRPFSKAPPRSKEAPCVDRYEGNPSQAWKIQLYKSAGWCREPHWLLQPSTSK